jgi:hypothetical protein
LGILGHPPAIKAPGRFERSQSLFEIQEAWQD